MPFTGVAQEKTALGSIKAEQASPDNPPDIREGMTEKDVRVLLGSPQRKAKQILYRRYLEQWAYERPSIIRIEFECVLGQLPRVKTVEHAE
jgi:hypothetical protein